MVVDIEMHDSSKDDELIEKNGGSIYINPEQAIYDAYVWFLQKIYDAIVTLLEELDDITEDDTLWLRLFSGVAFKIAWKDPVTGWEIPDFVPEAKDFSGKTWKVSIGPINLVWTGFSLVVNSIFDLLKLWVGNVILSDNDLYWYDRDEEEYVLGSTFDRKYMMTDLLIDIGGVTAIVLIIKGLNSIGFSKLGDKVSRIMTTTSSLSKNARMRQVHDEVKVIDSVVDSNASGLVSNSVSIGTNLAKLILVENGQDEIIDEIKKNTYKPYG